MKYSKQQLKSMGETLIAAKNAGDERYIIFCTSMMFATGLSFKVIEQKILDVSRLRKAEC